MTKKDYKIIGNGLILAHRDINISTFNHDIAIATLDTIINFIGNELEKENKKFDFKRFKNYILADIIKLN